ncbi:MAG: osmoprotectant transport system ATP-binding protein, partial [Frankiaceae bacterium]|nr:osmoprotectant transport system ATP-binding protein [Frankiaceae bacterium]
EGGHLEQYADPKALLSVPATEFVADFVGADRTLRRLAVLTVDPALLVRWPVVAPDLPLADALAVIDGAEAEWAVVADAAGVRGWLGRAVARAGSGDAGSAATRAAVVTPDASLEQALAALLGTGGPGVVVAGPDGYVGVLTEGAVLTGARR